MSQDEIRKELLRRFKLETDNNLSVLVKNLKELETDPENSEALTALFRAATTIQGNSRMMNFKEMHSLANHLETVFGAMRDEGLRLTASSRTTVYEATESLKVLVAAKVEGQTTTINLAELEQKLKQVLLDVPTKPATHQELITSLQKPQMSEADKKLGQRQEETTQEVIAELIDDIDQNLSLVQRWLVDLESEPNNKEYAKEVLHALHTVAANVKVISIPSIEELIKQMSVIMGSVAEDKIEFTSKLNDLLFEANEVITQISHATVNGQSSKFDPQNITEQLQNFYANYNLTIAPAQPAVTKYTLGAHLYLEILKYLHETTAFGEQRVEFSCAGGEYSLPALTIENLKAEIFKKFFGLWMGKPVLQIAIRAYPRNNKLLVELICNGELFEFEKDFTL